MEKVLVQSRQPGVSVKHTGKPDFKVTFHDKPVLINKEIADFLLKQDPSNFSLADGKDLPAEEPKTERLYSKTQLKDMSKDQQVKILRELNSSVDVPNKEDERIALILKLQQEGL